MPYDDSTSGKLKQAWGEWLTELADWDWYATLTFRNPSQEEIKRGYTRRGWAYAQGAWGKFLNALPCVLREEKWVRMFEIPRWRGVPHIHALVAGVGDLRRDAAWQWWFTRYGFARILPYRANLGAGYYLCKYITKEISDIKFGDGLSPQEHITKGIYHQRNISQRKE